MTHAPTMTQFDLDRLEALSDRLGQKHPPPPTLGALERQLDSAVVVQPNEVPRDVVTMNSQVRVIDPATSEAHDVTLVFPTMTALDEGRVSVLAPMGLALLGSREGDLVEWLTPRGTRRARVERVLYQPEAAGHFDV